MYCPECGEEIVDEARYCRHCGEDVAGQDTGVEETEPIEQPARVEHQCQSCGEMLRSGEPPCKHCGGMEIETRPIEAATSDGGVTTTAPADASSPSSEGSSRDTHFYIGAVLAVVGVIVFPYVFVFVALPEAIAALFGRSIQNALGKDAQDNPFVSGSFLILRWFGNFLILLFVIGVVIGVLLAL